MKHLLKKVCLGLLVSLSLVQACQIPNNVNSGLDINNKNAFNTKATINLSIPSNYSGSTVHIIEHIYNGEPIGKQGGISESSLSINKDPDGRIYIGFDLRNNSRVIISYLPTSVTSLKTGDVINFTLSPENNVPNISNGYNNCKDSTGGNVYDAYGSFINYYGSAVAPLNGAQFTLTVLENQITLKLVTPLMELPLYREDNCSVLPGNTFNIFTLDGTFNIPIIAPSPTPTPTATPTSTPTPSIPPTDCLNKNDLNNLSDFFKEEVTEDNVSRITNILDKINNYYGYNSSFSIKSNPLPCSLSPNQIRINGDTDQAIRNLIEVLYKTGTLGYYDSAIMKIFTSVDLNALKADFDKRLSNSNSKFSHLSYYPSNANTKELGKSHFSYLIYDTDKKKASLNSLEELRAVMSAIDKSKLPNSTTTFGGLDLKRAGGGQGLDYKLGNKNIDVKVLADDLLSERHIANIKIAMNTVPSFVLLLDERGADNNPELLNKLVTKLSSGDKPVSNPRQYITEVKPNDFVKLRAGTSVTSVEF